MSFNRITALGGGALGGCGYLGRDGDVNCTADGSQNKSTYAGVSSIMADLRFNGVTALGGGALGGCGYLGGDGGAASSKIGSLLRSDRIAFSSTHHGLWCSMRRKVMQARSRRVLSSGISNRRSKFFEAAEVAG